MARIGNFNFLNNRRKSKMIFSQNIIEKLKLFALIVLPLLFYILPEKSICEGQSICLFVNVFGVECFGCGMTRAIYSAMHFNFETALSYNKLVVVVLPLLIFLWTKMLYKVIKDIKTSKSRN